MPQSYKSADPGILEIVGHIANLLGLGEHIQRWLPIDRVKAGRRHRRVAKLLDSFQQALVASRTALRAIGSVVEVPLSNAPNGSVAFPIPFEELPIFRHGVEQLLVAIRKLTSIALELETITAGIPTETERFYKISEAGSALLRKVQEVVNGSSHKTPELIREADKYLTKCAALIRERENWIRG